MFLTNIEPYIAQHGYWAVFVIVLLESAGVPLPGETALILAAGYAGATGQMNLLWIIIAAAAGAILGDNLGFWIGRRWGAKFLLRYGKYIHLPESRLRLGQFLFKKHGAKIVFFGRFVAFLRVLAALLPVSITSAGDLSSSITRLALSSGLSLWAEGLIFLAIR